MNEFGPDNEKSATDAEGVMFASQPIWERNRKRRGLGGRRAMAPPPETTAAPETTIAPEATVAPEPRSFASDDDMILDRPVGAAGVTAGAMTADEVAPADAPLAAPIGRPSTRADRQPRSHGTGPAMIATGAVALVALAAGGWYLSRPHEAGVPTLTPGAATTSQVAAAPLPPVDLPPTARAQMANPAANPPPSARTEAPMRMARAAPVRTTVPARARPAAAASAGSSGVNASATATLPDAPQPYSRLNPNAPAPVNPAPAPTQAAPPTTQTAPPAEIPQTPPTQSPQQATPPSDTTPPDTTTTPPSN